VAADAKANNFASMIWNGAPTVAFGVKGGVAVAWYCGAAGAPPALATATSAKLNVKKVCIVAGMNSCLNTQQLAVHNEKRRG